MAMRHFNLAALTFKLRVFGAIVPSQPSFVMPHYFVRMDSPV